MRWKQAFIQTYREEPRDAEATSHRLMLRGSLIRKLSSGVYNYLPLGYRSLRKVMALIREEMNRAGATELFLPSLHPAELWKATGRYEALGDDLLSLKNRAGTEFVLGPTHEEVITQIVSESVKSYKDLPFTLYQIQVKFRDEARPRYGVIRSKEFLMKDAYSFDRDEEGLDVSYDKMRKAYQEIFRRVGLDILEVSADPGMMGGKVSHEFMVKDPFGEDKIVSCAKCSSLTSLEIASYKVSAAPSEKPQKMESFSTPNLKTIEELEKNFQIPKEKLLKSIVYVADEKPVVVCLRGDHEVNETKLKKLLKVERCELADAEKIEKVTGAPVGFTGPVGLKKIKIVLDASADGECNWVTGANQKDKHLKNVNLGRDFQAEIKGDIRYATETDLCAECGGALKIETALEMGHIFKLGTRYSKPLKAQYLDEQGKKQDILMGCYGIGVNRILAAAIEQSHDEKGIIWTKSLAPYDVEIILLGDSEKIQKTAAHLEGECESAGIEVLVDDRDERAGVKFNDADLIGIPIQAIVSERNLKSDQLEIKVRKTGEASQIPLSQSLQKIQEIYESA